MLIVDSYPLAVMLCGVTMLCWGSWANTQKLASREWPFQLFYWDYAFGVLLWSLALAFTLGSSGVGGRGFLDDLFQARPHFLASAFLGGAIFNLSNILLVSAIDIAGMAVAFPIGVGLALVLGVISTYAAKPEGNVPMLALGVGCVMIAILLDAVAYRRLAQGDDGRVAPLRGIMLSVLAGCLMGTFYSFVARSMGAVDPESLVLEVGKLSPYTAIVAFSTGLFVSNFVWNSVVMAKPFRGAAVSYRDYVSRGSARLHLIGILGGIIWNVGMSFSILAAGAAGAALSYGLGQGATLIGALWGVFIWKEFAGAPRGTSRLLAAMFAFYVLGLGVLIASKI